MIRKLAFIALVLLMYLPLATAQQLIPIQTGSCYNEEPGMCNIGMLSNGDLDDDAIGTVYKGHLYLQLKFAGGAYNLSSLEMNTHDCYRPLSSSWQLYTLNTTTPDGYCPSAYEVFGLSHSTGMSGSLGGSWYPDNCNNALHINFTDHATYGRCAYLASDYYGSMNYIRISELKFWGYPVVEDPVTADFTGNPINGPIPLTVQLVDNSTGGPFTAYNWSGSGPGAMYFDTPTAANTSLYIPVAGNYTITHGVSSGSKSDIETKTDYIWVYNSSSQATTHAVARDLYTGYAINGAQVDMYDVENTSWTNTTTSNGIGSITTLLSHKINIWGSATGYEDDNLQNVPAVDGGYYSLLLKPTNITTYNTTPGNLTLVVTVQDLQLPHPTITGAEVTAAWGSQYASGTTNAAGNTFFTVPNNTAIHLSAFKSGYASGSKTHITGSANGGSTMETAVMYIGTDYVTPVPSVTLTTGPGGTIPQTVDPYPCVGDGSAQDTANCQRKQSGMAADLISYGPDLMDFFIMLTFIGGLLLITGKRR